MSHHAVRPLVAAISFLSNGSTWPAVVVSAFGGLVVAAIILIAIGRHSDVGRRVGGFVSPNVATAEPQRSLVERALGDKQSRKIETSPWLAEFSVELEVAELNLTVEQLILGTIVLTIIVGWLCETAMKSPLAALLGLFVPILVKTGVGMASERRRRAFSEQLPDNLQVISSAMRAGQSFVGALQSSVDDAPEPSRRELRRAVTDESLGIPLSEALGHVTERMQSEDFQHVAIVAALQRDTGGNTAEVIDLVADTIRERIEIRRMVRGLTAQGRLAGIVLSLLPVAILVLISIINPSYSRPLFHKTIGLVALGIGLCLCGAGSFAIKKIVTIKI